jgi:CRISPR-associated protein Csx16
MIYVITRHPGALQWLAQYLAKPYVHFTHLHDLAIIKSGDIVVGTLPINLIAKLNQAGVRYVHLHIDIPEHLRGQELTQSQLVQLGASLIEYAVIRQSAFYQ